MSGLKAKGAQPSDVQLTGLAIFVNVHICPPSSPRALSASPTRQCQAKPAQFQDIRQAPKKPRTGNRWTLCLFERLHALQLVFAR